VLDAVVVGGGVNGLVAATLLADAGREVVVLEGQETAGGACRSAEVTAPGFVSDLFSAFYPLGVASPILRDLRLDQHGLRWLHAPAVLAHPLLDGRTAVLSRDLDVTAASLEELGTGDGDAWRGLYDEWQIVSEGLLGSIFSPFPPVRSAAGLLRALGPAGALRFARLAVLPVATLAADRFAGEGGGVLLAGNALHADLTPQTAASAVYGWLLAMLGQQLGWPVPAGGAGGITDALLSRLRAQGVPVLTSMPVDQVVVRAGRVAGVRVQGGGEVRAPVVVANVDAITLYRNLIDSSVLPPRLLADLNGFTWDYATVKVDWALSAPIPWRDARCSSAGTVHLGGSLDDLTLGSQQLQRGLVPEHPFTLVGQMTTSDPSRSPAGTESAWAYCHVPQQVRGDAGGEGITGAWTARDVDLIVARMEAQVEAMAPGFGDLVLARYVQSPRGLEEHDGALHFGALNGGTAAVHQQLFFRPVPGLGRPETAVPGLYLASMSAHPGGGVHGAPGANAAKAVLLGPVRRRAVGAATRALYR